MAGQYIFTMYGLTKAYAGHTILKDIGLCFFPGAKIGVVGDNGSGKSTLLRIMAGEDTEFDGEAAPDKGIRIGFAHQEPRLDPSKTVRESIESAFSEIQAMLAEFDEVSAKMCEPLEEDAMDRLMNRMAELQDAIDAVDGWSLDRQLDLVADALVLPPDDLLVSNLSGGERRRVALAQVLLRKPDLLLLDEPTNHLDAETVEWLEGQLRDYPGTVIIVTHDRYFLDNVTKWILELEHTRGLPFEGNYSSWLEQKLDILAKSEKKDSPRRLSLERELKWIRMSARDRHELSRQRIADYERLLVDERAAINESSSVIEIPPGDRLGDDVLSFKNVSKAYTTNTGTNTLIKSLSFDMPRGAVVGLIGPNGAGKTTLFKMITGEEAPNSGTLSIGPTVQLAHIDQFRAGLDDGKTVWETISDGLDEIPLGSKMVPSRSYLGRFNFKGTDQQKKIYELSGGERNRAYLAKLIRHGGNFLLLDEPTNDLDVNAMRMLEDAIERFPGCVMVISHDRFFLDRICTHLLIFEGEGEVRWFEGNYRDYEEARKREQGDAFVGRRSRYRKLKL